MTVKHHFVDSWYSTGHIIFHVVDGDCSKDQVSLAMILTTGFSYIFVRDNVLSILESMSNPLFK